MDGLVPNTANRSRTDRIMYSEAQQGRKAEPVLNQMEHVCGRRTKMPTPSHSEVLAPIHGKVSAPIHGNVLAPMGRLCFSHVGSLEYLKVEKKGIYI